MRFMLLIAIGALVGCTTQEVQRDIDNALSIGQSPPRPEAPLDVSIALTSGTPQEMMRAAVETCLVEFRDLNNAVAIFQEAGWQTTPFGNPGAYELGKDEVTGSLDASDGTSDGCRFESSAVSIDQARAIGQGLVDQYFEGSYQAGSPEGATGTCDGFTIFPGRGLIVISYDGLGQDPTCPDPNGSSIIVSTSSS